MSYNMMTIEGVNQADADIESGNFSLNTAELMVTALKTMLARIAELEDTWTCDKCGGTWPSPHFDNPDLQADFDAVTTCSTCLSLEMAKDRIAELEAAYTQMESEINGHNEKLKLIPESGERPKNAIDGMRFLATWFDAWYGDAGSGRDIVQQDLRRWARELEAAAQWHDASEPPEELDKHGDSKDFLCKNKDGKMAVGYYSKYCGWLFFGLIFIPTEYRDLPPMPEGEA